MIRIKTLVNKTLFLHASLFVLVLVSVISIIRPHFFWQHSAIINLPVHSSLEMFGAFSSIFMAVLSMQLMRREYRTRYVFIAMGFLAMGIWDIFHAFQLPGQGFVLTHSLALLSASLVFVMIWFDWPRWIEEKSSYLLGGVLIVTVGLFILISKNVLIFPNMLENEKFTATAKLMNLTAGLLLLASFIKLYTDYLESKKIEIFLLAAVALLSALAGFVFPFSSAWTDSWWFWHVLRIISSLFVFGFMIIEYHKLLTQRERALKEIEIKHQQLLDLFNGIEDIIYVADPNSYNLLYLNDAAEKAWGKDILGKKCYAALQNRKGPCPFCTNDKILGDNVGKSVAWEFQNQVTKDWFRCFDKAIRWKDGNWVRFEIASNINDMKNNEKMLHKSIAQLKSFNKMAVGREKKMIELKQHINRLSSELGNKPPYDLSFVE